MGSFEEDRKICISQLIKLWVAERFLKTCKGKSLEEAAEDYLKDLIDRNLVFVRKWGSIGKMKTCGIHDILRVLCLKEARKDWFFGVVKKGAKCVERRIIFHEGELHNMAIKRTDFALYAKPFVRSVLCDLKPFWISLEMVNDLKLIRVFSVAENLSLESIPQLVNLRYLKSTYNGYNTCLPPMMCQLWYLQTLIIKGYGIFVLPYEIWQMPQLRHINVFPKFYISDTLPGGMSVQENYVLRNLQTLKTTYNLKFTEDVIARILNIKKLSVELLPFSIPSHQSLHNLDRLHNLQSLTCKGVKNTAFTENLALPQSLKKLTLIHCEFDWDSLATKVGSLPNLEKLKLKYCNVEAEWNTVEGNFLHLKFLEIEEWGSPRNLVCWTSESSHFPLLQHLVLHSMTQLEKIPSGIGDTLQSIRLFYCESSVIASAKQIVEEQESLGNEDLRLTIRKY